MKKTMSFILSAVILLSSVFCFGTTAFADTYAVILSGTYDYSSANAVLEIVNRERKEAGLSPLELDEELQDAAMYRAAETVVLSDHIRPNGEEWYTVSDKMHGENLAVGYQSADEVMEAWMNSEGHRNNILEQEFNSIGIGCFIYEGVYYWIQAFGCYEAEGNPILSGSYDVDEVIAVDDSIVPPGTDLLERPQNIRLTARGGDGERAKIEWDAVDGADGYLVIEVTNGTENLKGETFEPSFTFTDLVPGWTYEVVVVAYNDDGAFSISDIYTFGAACPTVQNLKATITGMHSIQAEWDVTTSHGYRLEWSTSADFSKDVNGTYISGTNSTSYTIKTEKPADQYYVRVRAYKLFNGSTIYGAFSEPVSLAGQLLPVTGVALTARGGDGERARIDWNAVNGAVRYEVYEITNGVNRLKGETTDTNFTFTDLVPGWTYEVKVVAYNAAGESSESEGYTFGAACPTVQNLKASVTDSNTIEAKWDVTTSHGYRLEWSTTSDFSKDVNGTYISGTNSTSYTIKTEKPADQYYVRVRAYKLFQDTTIYGAFTQPIDIMGIEITARGGDGERARIDWNDAEDAVRYEVYEITNGINRLKGNTIDPYFTFTDLVPGWTYEVKVVAYNADDEKLFESEGYTFGAACPTVQNLKASVTGTNTIEAQWDVTTSHGYRLEWSTSADFSKDVNGTYISGTNSTSYTIKTEKPADQYYVRVRAYKLFNDSTIYGAFSKPVSLAGQLLPVTGVTITARGGDGERARIDWNAVNGAVRYEVYEITNGINRLKGETTDTNFTFTDLVPGWTYEVKVVAYNAAGESAESEGYTFGAACPTVQNLKAEITDTNTIEAKWDVTTSHGYRLEWSTSADFSKDVNGTYISGTNSTSYTIKTEKPADQYYVRVRAYKLFNDSTIYGAFTSAQKAVNVAARNVQNEVNAYIESKGITVDDSMTPDNSSLGITNC